MMNRPSTQPPRGTREHAALTGFWRRTAWVALLFTLTVGLGMVGAHVRLKSSDPWRSPVLLDLKSQLQAEPRNEDLKDQIREMDLQLRERYFHLLSLKNRGVYLLIGGALVLVIATRRVRQLQQQPPMPAPDPEAGTRLDRQAQLARNAVAACSVMAVAVAAVIALQHDTSPLSQPERLSTLLAPADEPATDLAPPSDEVLKQQWHRFRGYQGGGVVLDGMTLNQAPSVQWQAPSPTPGFSSPIIWGDRLFLTGGDKTLREVVALNKHSGSLDWRQAVSLPQPDVEEWPEIPEMTGYAAPTPASDGERVYALFATGELAAFTTDGVPVWSTHLGPLDNPYGHATSLLTWMNLLIVQLDQGYEDSRTSRILAFDGRTGERLWQRGRPVGASWATPIVADIHNAPQLITLGAPWVMAYSPTDGTELWRAQLLEGEITPSPIAIDNQIVLVDPGTYQLMAVRADGAGDVSDTPPLWRVDGDTPDVTSPVSDGKHIFTADSSGTVSCFNAVTGQELWHESPDMDGQIQASPCLIGRVLLIVSTAGDLIAVEAGNTFREVWRLRLADAFYASPAFAGGQMILRGNETIWCLGPATDIAKEDPQP